MKTKVIIIILAVACAVLGIALLASKKQAADQHEKDMAQTVDYSNQVVGANEQLKEFGQVNLTLSNDLASAQQQVAASAEQMAQLSNSLMEVNASLKSTLVSAQETVTNLNNRISELEAQNKVLDDQAQSMSNQLAQLTQQIEDTKTKLAVALTNSDFLRVELQKQLVAKAELEHKFYDLDELRAQVKKVKDVMFVARRMALGNPNDKKGGELLMAHTPASSASQARKPASAYDLNVEVGSDGSVKLIPPVGSTNSPAH